jgi:glycosyltransferase involved in cell wall biosynthesis
MNIVVFLTHNLSLLDWKRIGILNRELSLYQKLTEKNCKFKIITYGNLKDKRIKLYKNIEIFPIYKELKRNNNFFFKFFYPIYFICKNRVIFKDCNLIKTNQIIGGHLAVIAKILFRKKLIIRLGYEPYILVKSYSKNLVLKYLYKLNSIFCFIFADYIIVTSNQIREKIIKYYSVSKKKIGVNPNFVDTDKFTIINNGNKNKYFNTIFTISRLDEQKNLEFLFNQVKESSIQLHIYGSLKGIKKYKDLINEIGCDVRFKGPIDNEKLPMIINNYLIFILLSHSEGNPKALLEAMSCGRIAIGRNVEGINNIIKDQSNGFILDNNKNNLKNIIFKIKTKNKKKLLSIQKKARKFILQNFCLKKIVLRELKIYKKVENKN